jgi:fructokinase
MPDIICLGEALVDMISTAPGLNLVQSPQFDKAAGGAPTNVAAGAAILGGSAGLIAQVGQDSFGEYLRQTLSDVGVDLAHFLVRPEYATQLAFVALDGHGVPEFAFHVKQSADQMLDAKTLDEGYLREGQIFHFGSITLIHEPSRTATLNALNMALDEGLLISLDPNLRPPLWPNMELAYDRIHEVIPHCDFLKVSEQEMTFLTGQEGIDAGAAALHDLGPELVAVTRGPAGAIICNGSNILEVPAFRVPVLDTTGCGDAFVAATLVRMIESDHDIADMDLNELTEIFRFASATAALTATAQGAIPAMPGREEVEELLELGELPMLEEPEDESKTRRA